MRPRSGRSRTRSFACPRRRDGARARARTSLLTVDGVPIDAAHDPRSSGRAGDLAIVRRARFTGALDRPARAARGRRPRRLAGRWSPSPSAVTAAPAAAPRSATGRSSTWPRRSRWARRARAHAGSPPSASRWAAPWCCGTRRCRRRSRPGPARRGAREHGSARGARRRVGRGGLGQRAGPLVLPGHGARCGGCTGLVTRPAGRLVSPARSAHPDPPRRLGPGAALPGRVRCRASRRPRC